jgi:magnesium transporter
MSDAILFDSNEVAHLDRLEERPRRLRGSQLLWVDLDRRSSIDTSDVAEAFDLHESTVRYLATPHEKPAFFDHGHYLHITTYAPRDDDEGGLHAVECVVGESWVLTAHDEPIPVLDAFADRVSGPGETGVLDGPRFLAALLEWVLGSYSAAFERMEQRLEEFDIQAMRGDGSEADIEVLVAMRQQLCKLRRAVASHRSALVALTHPELVLLGDSIASERFLSLYGRYESTVQEARDARDVIVGSFDVLIARGGHHTNEIMKVLTLTSVILLPGALLAGVMGMNFKVGFFDHAAMFWVVLAVIVGVAPITLGVAKLRRWI